MHFTHFECKNAGPFEHLDLTLQQGSIGVFGRNGKGKSTLLNFLFALITNDFSRFDGLKVDCVRNTAGDKEESFIAGTVVHDGHMLEIKRKLRGSKETTRLVVDGGSPITDANKAQEEIDHILGLDRKMLDLYVFKTQDRIYDFLSTTPAERAKAAAVFCRTEFCERIWDTLGQFLNKDAEVNAQLVDNSDELTRELAEFKQKEQELLAAQAQVRELLLNAKSLHSAKQLLLRRDRLETLRSTLGKARGRRQDLAALLDQSVKRLARRQEELDKQQADYRRMKPQAEDAAAALKAVDAYNAYRKRRQQLKQEMATLEEEGRLHPPPKFPRGLEGVAALADLNKCLVAWEGQLEVARRCVATFAKEGVIACPTCGTVVTALAGHLEEQRRLAREMPAQIKAVEDQVDLWDQYNRDVSRYEKWRAGHEARAEANRQSREALKDIQAPDGDESKLRGLVQSFHVEGDEVEGSRQKVREYQERLARDHAELDSCDRALSQLEQEIAENTDPDDKVERARRRLEEHAEAEKQASRLEGEAAGIVRLIGDREDALKRLRARLHRGKKVLALARVVGRARDVLHRDRLPRRVAQANLSRMEGDVNRNLAQFGDPFWVETDNQLSFVAHKPGEPPQPAGRLSTGQKVVLALAFWPAVASLWAQDVGVLALDEPTANLDDDNRKFLAGALTALAAEVRDRRQVILVTHDHNLRQAFDQVIDLGV